MACILPQYHWDKGFHFPGKFLFLIQTITDSVRIRVVFSTVSGVMFCEIYLQFAAHITTIYLFILFSSFFNRCSIPIPDLDPPSSILSPGFPVYLKVLPMKIVLFSTTEVINCSKVINTFKQ